MKTPLSTLSAPLRVMKKLYVAEFFAVFVIVGLLAGYFSLNAASSTRNKPLIFQGRITDNSYVPLADSATVYLRFAFYTAASSGDCLWATGTDTTTGSNNCPPASSSTRGVATTVTRGIFTVNLGDSTVTNMPVLPLDFNASGVFIGVTACTAADSGCDSEMTPRVRVGGAAYAYNADELDGRDSSQFLAGNETLTLPNITSASVVATTTIITFGAHTNRTAAELIDLDINMGRNVTFTTTGASIATQRAMRILPPTYLGTSATQTITNAATLAITGGPAASTFAAVTRPIDLWLQGDNMVNGNFLRITYPNATTLQTFITGLHVDLNTNLTASGLAGGQSSLGANILLPTSTNTIASTSTIEGMQITGNAINNTSASGSMNWAGVHVFMPDITQAAGTSRAIGVNIIEGAYTSGTSRAIEYTGTAVAHGMTAVAPTGVVYQLGTLNGGGAGTGGTLMTGLSDSDSPGMRIFGVIGTSGSSTSPALYLSGARVNSSDATQKGMLSAHEILLYISNDNAVRLTMNGSGDLGLGDPTPNGTLDLLSSTAASTTALILTHTNGADPVINFETTEGTGLFSFGVDNSVTGDPLKISASGTLGTSDILTVDPRATTSAVSAFTLSGLASTIASAASAEYTTLTVTPPTIVLTGTTAVSTAMDSIIFNAPTISDNDATQVAITNANNITISGAPIAGGTTGTAITNSVALRINQAAVNTGSGVVTNAYGFYVDVPTGATNNYAAVFATGNVGILTTTPNESLDVNGSIGVLRTGTASTDYTIAATDYYVGLTSTSARTVRPPTAASITGRVYVIKDEAGNAGTNNITIDPSGTETIDGATTATINANYGFRMIVSDGTNWMIISRE